MTHCLPQCRRATRGLPGVAPVLLSLCCAAAPASAQVQARPDRVGDVLRYALPLAAAAMTGVEQDLDGLEQLGLTAVASQGTTGVLKHVAHSKRPDGTGLGFPSGHASMAFASAAFVHERYGLQWGIPFYALASVTAYTRVHTHHHFTKDVVGGALVGVGAGFLLTDPRGDATRAVAVIPLPGGGRFEMIQRW